MFSWLLWFFLSLLVAAPAYSVEPCGKVKINAGTSCSSLEATIDLSGCQEPQLKASAQIVCDEDEHAKIRYEGVNYLYQGHAKPGVSGNWEPVGTVERYLKPGVQQPVGNSEKGKQPIPLQKKPKPPVKVILRNPPKAPARPRATLPVRTMPVKPPPIATTPSLRSPATDTPTVPSPATAPPPVPTADLPVLPVQANTTPVVPKTETSSNPLVVKGWFRLRVETNDKTDLVSNRSNSLFRARPSITYSPAPYATLTFAPQLAKAFGEIAYVGASTTANTLQETSGTTYDPALTVHFAFADFHPTEWFRAVIGRQSLVYGDEILLGGLEWNNVGRSFDGVKTRFSYGSGWTDLFWSKIQENGTSAAAAGDKDFLGLYNSWNLGTWLKETDLYAYYLLDASSKVNSVSTERITTQNLWTLGLRLKSTIGGFDHREEVNGQWLFYNEAGGFQRSATQADCEIGYTLNVPVKPRLGVKGFYTSKDFNQLFATAHKWLGYADVLGRRNISGFAVHASSGIVEDLKANLDYHYYLRTEADGTPFKLNGTTAIGSTASSSSMSVGQEIDLTVSYQATKLLNFLMGGSLFFPGSYITDQFTTLPPLLDFYFMQMELKF